MAINKAMKAILKVLSFDGVDVEATRQLANLRGIDPLKIFHKTLDYEVFNGDYRVPIRLFFPFEAQNYEDTDIANYPMTLFFHGGGWVSESIDNYDRICAYMAHMTERVVVSVGYRLAPEHPFPTGLMDCWAVYEFICRDAVNINIDLEQLVLAGDSAGGNLVAAISLMARDRGAYIPKRQILIYPAVNSDYSDNSKFKSVIENGSDYLLTQGRLEDYIKLYAGSEEDLTNPYFAPLYAKDYSNQPKTLVITGEFDPLRDEAEEYAKRLKAAGNEVESHRIEDALHGYLALGMGSSLVRKTYEYINDFLKEE